MKSKIGILGDGLLAKELNRQTGWDMISRRMHGFDITDPSTWNSTPLWRSEHGVAFYTQYTTLINCIAHTDTYSEDRDTHWDVNYVGVANLVEFCNHHNIKLVHISTDYIYSNSTSNASEEKTVPVHCENWYGYTKLLGDGHVQLSSDDYLLIRATHKAKPFSHQSAWINQIGNFDYVDVISEKIIKLVEAGADGVYNVGTQLKSMYNLAKQTNMVVTPEHGSYRPSTPTDTSMNITKMKNKLT
jgi:dTDP-4-dehydrorhamnose reductase